jgi:hypothetical protein
MYLSDITHCFPVGKKWETSVQYKGERPARRSFHTATAVGKRVVVLGGRSTEDKHFQDFHIFDTGRDQT